MTIKQILPVFAACIALTVTAAAGTPKSDAKSKDDVVTTYYVNGGDATNYTISTTQTKSCGTGSVVCKFTSPDPSLPSTISRAVVENEQNDIEIQSTRAAL